MAGSKRKVSSSVHVLSIQQLQVTHSCCFNRAVGKAKMTTCSTTGKSYSICRRADQKITTCRSNQYFNHPFNGTERLAGLARVPGIKRDAGRSSLLCFGPDRPETANHKTSDARNGTNGETGLKPSRPGYSPQDPAASAMLSTPVTL